jgi:hypothetical protein
MVAPARQAAPPIDHIIEIDLTSIECVDQASYSMDGREHPIIGSPDGLQSIKRVDALTTEGTLKKSGRVVQTVRREITKD